MAKKEIGMLVMGDSVSEPFELEAREPPKKKRKPRINKRTLNLDAIALNTAKVAHRLGLAPHPYSQQRPKRLYRKEAAYLSR